MLAAVITACVLTSCQDEDLADAVATSYTVPVATATEVAAATAAGCDYVYQVNGQEVTAAEYQAAAQNVTSSTEFTIAVVNSTTGATISSSSFVLRPVTADEAAAGQAPTITNTVNGIATTGYTIAIPTVTTNPTTGEAIASESVAVPVIVEYEEEEIPTPHTGGGGN
ncbi:MAG: hypothetical protein K6F94_05470 [Bacteroidaceae bacterium]|nr:hypothetical protein [Bacteroidaceae bacterium]